MPNNYRKEEEQFKDQISRLVRPHINSVSTNRLKVCLSSQSQDTDESWDMMVSTETKVSVRIRSAKHEQEWGLDQSIRIRSKHNKKTEIDKIAEGRGGDIYFTGWETPDGKNINSYIIVDIEKMRPHLNGFGYIDQPNRCDGTCGRYWDYTEIKKMGALIYMEDKRIYVGDFAA